MEIPKVFHQFWAGGEMPLAYRCFSQHLQDLHPDWDYILWNEESIPDLSLRYIYNYFKDNGYNQIYSVLSDLVRYEILLREGGVWIDTDMLILKNLDPLLEDKDLLIAKQLRSEHHMSLNSCFIAAPEYHYIHDIIPTVIESRFQEMTRKTHVLSAEDDERSRQKKMWNTNLVSTGPGMITSVIRACVPHYEPPSIPTFHPFSMGEVVERQLESIDSYGLHFFNCKNGSESIQIHKQLPCYEWIVNGGS
tara:strand:- start:60603 stop:61349 length:747 start_codon:yes stop_codon:yes gene_type:complete